MLPLEVRAGRLAVDADLLARHEQLVLAQDGRGGEPPRVELLVAEHDVAVVLTVADGAAGHQLGVLPVDQLADGAGRRREVSDRNG